MKPKPNKPAQSHLTGLQPDEIPVYWDVLVPLVQKPLDRMGADKYYTADDVLWKCVGERWQCWIAWSNDKIDCCFITYVVEYPTGFRSFVIYLVGGSRIDSWLDLAWNTFKAYAKEKGCGEISGMGRHGWLRELKKVEPDPIEEHLRFSVRI
jgi:hypothetical protein